MIERFTYIVVESRLQAIMNMNGMLTIQQTCRIMFYDRTQSDMLQARVNLQNANEG